MAGVSKVDLVANPAKCSDLKECREKFQKTCSDQTSSFFSPNTDIKGKCEALLSSIQNLENPLKTTFWSCDVKPGSFKQNLGNEKEYLCSDSNERPEYHTPGCAAGKAGNFLKCIFNKVVELFTTPTINGKVCPMYDKMCKN